MANQDELFDFNEEQKQLQKLIDNFKALDATIMKVSADALTAGKNINAITLPSDLATFTAQNAQLNAIIKAQADALAKLQAQYNGLAGIRKNNSQRTAEEAINQGILNRNALEAARINSTLAGAYFKLNAEHAKAARYLQDLIARGKLATQTQKQYNKEIETAQKDFDKLNQRILAADRAVGRFNRNVGNYPMQAVKGLKDLLSAFGIAGGLQLFAQIAKDIFETTKEIQSMDMALKQVTQTQEIYATSQMFLSRISEAYGADLGKLTTQFTQFYVSAKDKLSGNQIEDIFESITKAGATMGLSTEKQERAFLALNQMMSKGTIQAEELKGQLGEALPGALGIMAKALGVTEIKLAQMMKDGQLLAADVLPKFAKQLEITYGIENVHRVETLAAAQSRYTNAWRDFVRGLDEDGNKLSNFMKKAIGVGTDLLIGISRLAESDQATRNRILKTLQESGFNQTLSYYKSLDELKKEDLENDKAYTLQKVKEETEEFNRLKRRQLILKAITPEAATFDVQMDPKAMKKLVEGKAEMAENAKKLNEINNLLSKRKGTVQALNKLLDEGKKVTKEDTELTKEQLKEIEDAFKARYEMAKKEIELQILKQETILNGETNTYKEQYAALEKYSDLKMQLITLDYNEHVRLAKGNADKITSADLDMQMAIIKQSSDTFAKIKSIRKKENDDYIQEIKDIEAFLKSYYDNVEGMEDAALEVYMKGYNSRKEAYDKEEARLKELKKATKDYLDSFGEELASNTGFGETFNMLFKQIEDANGKMTTMFKQLLEGADGAKEKFAVYFNAIAESAQEAFNFISNASTQNFDSEKTRLEDQYNVALRYAGDNKEAQEKLAQDLEKSKKDIANREAKAKQKQAIFNIAIDTAQGVVSALASTPPNIVLSAIIGAIGLAQIAVVSSQQVPQYWMGGEHAGGKMMINDGAGSNWKETFVTPDGKAHQATSKNAIVDAPKGTKIYTHDQWLDYQREVSLNNMLSSNNIDRYVPVSQQKSMTKDDFYEVMGNTLGRQTIERSNLDANGFSKYTIKKGNSITRRINRANGKA